MKRNELLKRALNQLKLTYKDEKCDHSVNICFCDAFRLMDDIKEFLKKENNKIKKSCMYCRKCKGWALDRRVCNSYIYVAYYDKNKYPREFRYY